VAGNIFASRLFLRKKRPSVRMTARNSKIPITVPAIAPADDPLEAAGTEELATGAREEEEDVTVSLGF